MTHRFCIVDVFAEEKYAGNQLAVVAEAGDLPGETMQRIARETNFSETTFVTGEREGGFDVRIFTPALELPFAGHPTLGTAWVLRHEFRPSDADELLLHLGVGDVPVRFRDEGEGEILWLEAPDVQLGRILEGAAVAELLDLPADALAPDLPVQEVSVGIPFTFVPVAKLPVLRGARFRRDRWDAGSHDFPAQFFLFCPEAYDARNQMNARMFAELGGVPEDPATGSANAGLGGYLLEHRGGPLDLRVEQGTEVGRPSLLRVRASRDAATPRIEVGGRVVLAARGELV